MPYICLCVLYMRMHKLVCLSLCVCTMYDWVSKTSTYPCMYVFRFCKPFVCIIPRHPNQITWKSHIIFTQIRAHLYTCLSIDYHSGQIMCNVYTCLMSRASYLKFWLEIIRMRRRQEIGKKENTNDDDRFMYTLDICSTNGNLKEFSKQLKKKSHHN